MTTRLLDFPVVDAHFHLWDRAANPYPWLAEDSPRPALGDHHSLMRDFLLADHAAEIGRHLDIGGGVHVEAGSADPAAETRWVADIARHAPFPIVHVARLDLMAADAPSRVTKLAAETLVRGFRMRLNADPRIAGPAGIADHPTFRNNFAAVAETGRLFELSLYPPQAAEGERLARDFSETTFVLNHLGWPRIGEGLDDFAGWRRAMAIWASCPNMTVKLSMLWPIDRSWRPERIRPFVAATLDLFGPDRVLFGSNFPVETVMGSAGDQLSALLECLTDLPRAELKAVFRDNAARIYGLGPIGGA